MIKNKTNISVDNTRMPEYHETFTHNNCELITKVDSDWKWAKDMALKEKNSYIHIYE